MIICSCNVLSDHDVRACVGACARQSRSPADVHRQLGCEVTCGRCAKTIREVVRATLSANAAQVAG